MAKRGDIYWINFDPAIGSEIKKIRPALIVFSSAKRVIASLITSNTQKVYNYQLVIKGLVKGRDGKILLDQIRSFDRLRLLKKINRVTEMLPVEQMLKAMFFGKSNDFYEEGA